DLQMLAEMFRQIVGNGFRVVAEDWLLMSIVREQHSGGLPIVMAGSILIMAEQARQEQHDHAAVPGGPDGAITQPVCDELHRMSRQDPHGGHEEQKVARVPGYI